MMGVEYGKECNRKNKTEKTYTINKKYIFCLNIYHCTVYSLLWMTPQL